MSLSEVSVFPRTFFDRSVVVSSLMERDSLVPIVLNSVVEVVVVLYQVSTVVAGVPIELVVDYSCSSKVVMEWYVLFCGGVHLLFLCIAGARHPPLAQRARKQSLWRH